MHAVEIQSHRELIDSRQPWQTMPGELFGRQDVFDTDVDVFFNKHWILVAVTADVPEAGDVYAVDIGKSSILICRDDDEKIRAYRNSCRHRGARLKEPGKSTVGMLVCPYHQWTYDLNGVLKHATHMGPDFDMGCRSLSPVHVRVVGEGLIFVCLSQEAPADFDLLANTMNERFAPYHLGKTKIAYEADVIENGNWKLVIENNRECYHCAGTHPELTTSFLAEDFGFCPDGLSEEGQKSLEAYNQKIAETVSGWEKDGLVWSAVEEVGAETASIFRTQRLVIAGCGESQTMDTQVECQRLLADFNRRDLGDVHLHTHSSWSHVMSDHAVISYLIPLAPDRTLVRTKWLVNENAVEGVDYDVKRLVSVWTATNMQDAKLVEISHAGTQDPGYVPGPYSRYTEALLEAYANWYSARLAAHGV